MDGEEHEAAGGSSSISSRACDACRSRKIRCNRVQPCSNCRVAQVACRFSPRVNETRPRVLISSKYEKQVESIDERLQGIEESLQALLSEKKKLSSDYLVLEPADAPRVSGTVKTMRKLAVYPNSSTPIKSEEDDKSARDPSLLDTSFVSHSMHAKGLFEKLNARFPTAQNKRLKKAIATLQATIQSQSRPETVHDLHFTDEQPGAADSRISEMEVPPVEAVLGLLRSHEKTVPRFFLETPAILQEDFTEMCQTLYFYTSGYSPALFSVVNGGLYYLFKEQHKVSGSADDLRYTSMCRTNFLLSLESFHLTLAPSIHACQALILGACYAADLAKPSLCLRFTSTAAQMCHTLGYHRLPKTAVETRETLAKKCVFWCTYALDKGLSLRLGRASILQDYDISTTFPRIPVQNELYCWHSLVLCWVEFSKFQGLVFTECYTVAALSGPQAARETKARRLAAEFLQWRQKVTMLPMPDSSTPHQEEFRMARDSTDVVYYTVLTIIYQAIPASPGDISPIFNSDCIISARKALEYHRVAASQLKQNDTFWRDYIHWTLLYSPFVPFLVVFSEAVATLNVTDLQNLRDFVASIEASSEISEAAKRLYELCAAFYEVANVYFEESSALGLGPDPNVIAINSLAPKLLQQPFVQSDGDIAADAIGMSVPVDNSSTDFEATNVADLNSYTLWPTDDWFLPDQYMMGILQDTNSRLP